MTDIVDELRARALQGRFNLEAADEIERLRAELSEQCRLLGMSGEREAKHLAQIAALEKERDALRARIEAMEPTMQDALMKFDPATGEERPYPSHATQWRNWHGIAAWLFDPWTGKRRNAYDVGSDVHGLLIVPTGTLGMDMGGGCAEKNNVAAAPEAKP